MILCFVLVLRLASFWILIPLYLLAVLFPWISVLIRRIHDTEKSCLDLMLIVIPILGPIVVMIWLCIDSQPGSNKYGPNPKENQISIQSKSIIRS